MHYKTMNIREEITNSGFEKRVYTLLGVLLLVFVFGANGFAQCNADFTLNYSPNDSTTIILTDTTKDKWKINQWDMGDGVTFHTDSSTLMHRYNNNGLYSVCHTLQDSQRSCYDKKCQTVLIKNVNAPCKARFSEIVNGLDVSFNNLSTKATSSFWVFGDGNVSTKQSPIHSYKTNQTTAYNVCLFTLDSNSGCRDTVCKAITITPPKTCKAAFTFVGNNLDYAFTNSSKNADSFFWDFGDGDISDQRNPFHTFKNESTYTVCLTIQDTLGCSDSVCMKVDVFINRCKAKFVLAIDTTQKFKLYLLNRSSSLGSHSYYWDFGDGTKSTQRNPAHQYATFGAYNVCLVVSDSVNNCSSSWCDTIGLDSNGKLLKAGFQLEIIEDIFFSVPKHNALNTHIYPNPVTNRLNFKLDGYEENVSVEIVSSNGKKVYEQSFTGIKEEFIDVSSLLGGVYILSISIPTSSARIRFIKIQ